MKTLALDDIALAQATPQQARSALGTAMAELSPEVAQRVYAVLRAWVWKALEGRRRDTELRDWFDVLRRTRAQLEGDYALHAERLRVLHDLVRDSIEAAEILSPEQVMKRSHVRDVLKLLSDNLTEQMDRALIGNKLDLKQANLTRILNMMSSAGLVERATYGKQALYQLTPLGIKAARSLHKTAAAAELPAVARIVETLALGPRHTWFRSGRRRSVAGELVVDRRNFEEFVRIKTEAAQRSDEAAKAREHSLALRAGIRSESHKDPHRSGNENLVARSHLQTGTKRRATYKVVSVEIKPAKSAAKLGLPMHALSEDHFGE